MGKLTISMAMFNSKLLVITRGYVWWIMLSCIRDWTFLQRKMGTGRADRGGERFGKGDGPPVVFVGLCSPHELTSLM